MADEMKLVMKIAAVEPPPVIAARSRFRWSTRDALVCLAVFAISLAASVAIVDTTAERLGLDSNEMGQGCITALFKWLESRSMTGSVLTAIPTLPEREEITTLKEGTIMREPEMAGGNTVTVTSVRVYGAIPRVTTGTAWGASGGPVPVEVTSAPAPPPGSRKLLQAPAQVPPATEVSTPTSTTAAIPSDVPLVIVSGAPGPGSEFSSVGALTPSFVDPTPYVPVVLNSSRCTDIFGIVSSSPQFSIFASFINAQSLQNIIQGGGAKPQTIFLPVNNAFTSQVFQMPYFGATNISGLINNHPEVFQTLFSYGDLPQPVSTTQLLTGIPFNTSSAVGLVPLTLSASSGAGGVQVLGIGSTATILQGDIPACGGAINSVVHVVDTVLLPFPKSGQASVPPAFVRFTNAAAPLPATDATLTTPTLQVPADPIGPPPPPQSLDIFAPGVLTQGEAAG